MSIYYLLGERRCRIAAVVDVNQSARERAVARIQKAGGAAPHEYSDMRKMFESKDIDAVSLPVPNHWHALAAIWACQAGKDVYVEKPACHNIYEGRQMVAAAPDATGWCRWARRAGRLAHKNEGHSAQGGRDRAGVSRARGCVFRLALLDRTLTR